MAVGSGLVGLYLKSSSPREKDSSGRAGRWVTREERGQGKVTETYHWVVQNKVYLTYACMANVKASSLQQLETWLIHPTALLLLQGQIEINITEMRYGPLVSTLGIVLASTKVWLVPPGSLGASIGTHCWGAQPYCLVVRSCMLKDLCPDSRLFMCKCALKHMCVPTGTSRSSRKSQGWRRLT